MHLTGLYLIIRSKMAITQGQHFCFYYCAISLSLIGLQHPAIPALGFTNPLLYYLGVLQFLFGGHKMVTEAYAKVCLQIATSSESER